VSVATPEAEPALRGPVLPLLLLLLAFLGWGAIQTTQLVSDRLSLQAATSQQRGQLEAARKIRVAADSLAAKLKVLADKGNPDAKLVIAKLKEHGVSINPKTTASVPP